MSALSAPRFRARAVLPPLLLALAACAPEAGPRADLILRNGQIVTADDAFTIGEAIAVRTTPGGSEILAVGSESEVMGLEGPETRVVDLDGRTVIPGINDIHLHFSLLGLEAGFQADLRRAQSVREIVDVVAELKERVNPEPGEWLVARGWDEFKYERPFTRWDLDEITPDNPLEMPRVYRGAAYNTRALNEMGIRDDDPSTWPEWWLEDPASFTLEDKILRERRPVTINGQTREMEVPTGMFIGNATQLVTVRSPALGFEDQVGAVRAGAEEMARLGVTSIIDPGGGGRVMRVYQEAYRRGWLPIRISQVYEGMFNTQTPEEIAARMEAIPFNDFGDRSLRWRGTKWQIDGGAGTRSSWVTEPFVDWETIEGTPNHGYHWADDPLREAQFRAVVDRGWDVHVHATGDLGMRQTVDLYAKLQDSIRAIDPDRDMRWSVIHAYLPMEPGNDMLAKMAEYGIVAAVNPSFIWHQGRSFSQNLGAERMARLMPFKSYLEAGVPLAVGSDFGTSPHSPWIGLYALLTRKDLYGDAHNPEEALGIEDALRAMTRGGAYLTYEEGWKGTLEPGKVADLVILDITDIRELELNPEMVMEMEDRVLATLVDGRVVFQKDGFAL